MTTRRLNTGLLSEYIAARSARLLPAACEELSLRCGDTTDPSAVLAGAAVRLRARLDDPADGDVARILRAATIPQLTANLDSMIRLVVWEAAQVLERPVTPGSGRDPALGVAGLTAGMVIVIGEGTPDPMRLDRSSITAFTYCTTLSYF